MLMEINHRETTPGVVVIALSGRVMLGPESEQIVALVEGLLHHGKGTIIFDLAGVRRLDSTGIGRFIACYNEILARGGKMRMAGATGHLLDVFRVTRLDLVFPFMNSRGGCKGLTLEAVVPRRCKLRQGRKVS